MILGVKKQEPFKWMQGFTLFSFGSLLNKNLRELFREAVLLMPI